MAVIDVPANKFFLIQLLRKGKLLLRMGWLLAGTPTTAGGAPDENPF
jgi:hypothetical protein